MSKAIEITNLTQSYNGSPILNKLNMSVPEGSVYAFLGRNGAGKTTTIKLLLGLLERSAGTVKVLGLDPALQGPELMQLVGYVSEDRTFYDWMTASEAIRFTSAFYKNWDADFAAELVSRLKIRLDKKIAKLSRGERGKLALMLALAYRPKLLILDEPTSGLDSVVRRQFIEETVELIAQEGRTVFFSTHLIEEVERIADHVAILSQGHLVVDASQQELKESFRRVRAYFDKEAADEFTPPEEALNFKRTAGGIQFHVANFDNELKEKIEQSGAKKIEAEAMSLDDIFVELTREEDLND